MKNPRTYNYLFILLFVFAFKTAEAQTSVTVCSGAKGVRYQVIGAADSKYHWNIKGGKIVSDSNASTIMVNWGVKSGNYQISVFEEKVSGCLGNTKRLAVNIIPSPVFDLGEIVNICEGTSAELVADANPQQSGNTYLWQDGSTSASKK
jgi:hypothetical protein